MKCSLRNNVERIGKYIETKRYERHQKELNRLVNLEGVTQTDAANQLYTARDGRLGLASYAKANNVSIKFWTKNPEEKKLGILVKGKTNQYSIGTINSDTEKTEIAERYIDRMLENSDGLNYRNIGTEQIEDTFLGRVYRKVCSMIEDVKQKK